MFFVVSNAPAGGQYLRRLALAEAGRWTPDLQKAELFRLQLEISPDGTLHITTTPALPGGFCIEPGLDATRAVFPRPVSLYV